MSFFLNWWGSYLSIYLYDYYHFFSFKNWNKILPCHHDNFVARLIVFFSPYLVLSQFWVVREMFYFIKWSICFCTALQSAPAPPIFFIRQKVLYIIKKKFENRKDVPFPLEKVKKNKPSLFLKNARDRNWCSFLSLLERYQPRLFWKKWMLIFPSLLL